LIGSTVQITLAANGTTTGTYTSLRRARSRHLMQTWPGTWSQTGNVIDFTQAVDNFVNECYSPIQPIATGVWDLIGDDTFSERHVQLTLRHGA